MREKVWKIRDLEWKCPSGDWYAIPITGMKIELRHDGSEWCWRVTSDFMHGPWFAAGQLKDAKAAAESHWHTRLAGALEEVT